MVEINRLILNKRDHACCRSVENLSTVPMCYLTLLSTGCLGPQQSYFGPYIHVPSLRPNSCRFKSSYRHSWLRAIDQRLAGCPSRPWPQMARPAASEELSATELAEFRESESPLPFGRIVNENRDHRNQKARMMHPEQTYI